MNKFIALPLLLAASQVAQAASNNLDTLRSMKKALPAGQWSGTTEQGTCTISVEWSKDSQGSPELTIVAEATSKHGNKRELEGVFSVDDQELGYDHQPDEGTYTFNRSQQILATEPDAVEITLIQTLNFMKNKKGQLLGVQFEDVALDYQSDPSEQSIECSNLKHVR